MDSFIQDAMQNAQVREEQQPNKNRPDNVIDAELEELKRDGKTAIRNAKQARRKDGRRREKRVASGGDARRATVQKKSFPGEISKLSKFWDNF